MTHIAQILETTFANWQAPRPMQSLTAVHARFLQVPLFATPETAAAVVRLRDAAAAVGGAALTATPDGNHGENTK